MTINSSSVSRKVYKWVTEMPTNLHLDYFIICKDYALRKGFNYMERLTKRTPKGIAYMAIADTLTKNEQELEGSKPILEGIYAMFQKLANYEDKDENKEPLGDGGRIPFSYYCPNCKEELSDGGWKPTCNYCENCGQKIKHD